MEKEAPQFAWVLGAFGFAGNIKALRIGSERMAEYGVSCRCQAPLKAHRNPVGAKYLTDGLRRAA